jgi:hypothetical protein
MKKEQTTQNLDEIQNELESLQNETETIQPVDEVKLTELEVIEKQISDELLKRPGTRNLDYLRRLQMISKALRNTSVS